MIELGILVIHLHLVNTITSHGLVHGIVHLRLIVVVNDFSSLGLNSRLPNLGDKDAATATTFLGYIYKKVISCAMRIMRLEIAHEVTTYRRQSRA